MLNLSQNRISNIGGLASAPSLVALNLGEYVLGRRLPGTDARWVSRVPRLIFAAKHDTRVLGAHRCHQVLISCCLCADNNLLSEFEPGVAMTRLRILRLSGNRLQTLNATPYPNLRTLYADNNNLGPIVKAYRLGKLENLSLRNQGGRSGL